MRGIITFLEVHVKHIYIMEKKAGEIIQKNRKRLGYRQKEICPLIGTSRENYSKKETGKIPFTAGEFLTILSFFYKRDIKVLLPKYLK